ncbi:MAG: Moonbeam51 [Oscillospiraceae bacterium]|jgi:hypothetical protein|nr:Moonbeam51 [Oscillospiraceae bacterium]
MTNYFKPNLVQIDGGLKLRTDLDALLNAYDAAKVLTTIKKDGDTGNYNVDELLTTLKTSLDQISGGSGTSLTSLKEAIDALDAKVVKDVVRFQLTAAYANNAYTVTLPANIDTLVPGIDFAAKLPVFNLDNTSVFDATGAQLTFDFATKAFSGLPSGLDEVASKNAADGKLIYKPLAVDFDFKVFPTGKFTLQTLPGDYLLDNNELQLIAYDQAINKLIVKLAQDEDLIDAVKAQIGATAIKDQIDAAMAELTKTIADNKTVTDKAIADAETATVAALAVKINKADIVSTVGDTPSANKVASEKALADAIAAIKTAAADDSTDQINKAIADARKMIEDNVQAKTDAIATSVNTAITALTSRTKVFEIKDATQVVEFVLDEVPNATKVTLNINSFVYEEEDGAFTVDRDNKKITWVATAANGGFDIMNTLTDKVIVRYFTGVATVNQVLNKVLSGTIVPTTGTYNVGDRIYKTNPVVGENEGWICTVAGTPGAWVEFGIIDIKSAISVEDVTA